MANRQCLWRWNHGIIIAIVHSIHLMNAELCRAVTDLSGWDAVNYV